MSYGTVKSIGITITTVSGKSFHVQLDPFDPMSGGSGELLFVDTGLNSYFKVKSVADLCEKLPSCCMGLQYSRRAANAMKKYCEKITKSIQQLDDIDTLEFQRIVYSWGYEAVENADDLLKKLGYEWNKDESEENAAKRLNELFFQERRTNHSYRRQCNGMVLRKSIRSLMKKSSVCIYRLNQLSLGTGSKNAS